LTTLSTHHDSRGKRTPSHADGEQAPRTGLGWLAAQRRPVRALGTTIDNARAAGLHLPIGAVARYAEKTRQIAEVDVDRALEATSMDEALRTVALGTALLDPMLLTLRRLAQQVVAAEALGPDD